MPDFTEPTGALVERSLLRWLLLLYCLFILYGSFIPFHFSRNPEFVQSQWTRFFTPLFDHDVRQFSIPDVLSNILLFVPFGFFRAGGGIPRYGLSRPLTASFTTAALGLLFGLTIEFGQTFSPGRITSIVDALCNGIGSASPFGFLIAGCLEAGGSKTRTGLAALTALLMGATLEAGQLALKSRTPSITDVLVFGAAAAAGSVVFGYYRRRRDGALELHILRISLVSRHGKPRGESWKARARAVKKQFRPGPLESSSWSGSGGGRQGIDLLTALGRARPLVLEEREFSIYL